MRDESSAASGEESRGCSLPSARAHSVTSLRIAWIASGSIIGSEGPPARPADDDGARLSGLWSSEGAVGEERAEEVAEEVVAEVVAEVVEATVAPGGGGSFGSGGG